VVLTTPHRKKISLLRNVGKGLERERNDQVKEDDMGMPCSECQTGRELGLEGEPGTAVV
jgi:hypothetical protein